MFVPVDWFRIAVIVCNSCFCNPAFLKYLLFLFLHAFKPKKSEIPIVFVYAKNLASKNIEFAIFFFFLNIFFTSLPSRLPFDTIMVLDRDVKPIYFLYLLGSFTWNLRSQPQNSDDVKDFLTTNKQNLLSIEHIYQILNI